MDQNEIDELRKEARIAFKKKDFERTFVLSKKLADENVPAAFFRCGLILEKGWLDGKKDLDRALEFYQKLAIKWNADEGYLGCVRIMLAKKDFGDMDKAIHYCLDATNGPVKQFAYLLLGRVYEELCNPPNYNLAKKSYIKAIFRGSAWSMRKYANALMRSKNYMGGILAHVVITVIYPFYLFFAGTQANRKG